MATTLIIGNGIGMALAPDYFSLRAGLKSSWQSFNDKEKNVISLRNQGCPEGEEELEQQHVTATACKKLLFHKDVNLNFLSNDGEEFPNIYQEFIYRAAKHFYEYPKSLPTPFIEKFCNYIQDNFPCHIATLNYDKLIYSLLIERELCDGYSGKLVDGIYNNTGKFSSENLLRTYNNFGWYLQLHGSPIFRTQQNNVYKEKITDTLPSSYENDNGEHSHVVLTHTKYKADVISGSSLLTTYFDFFINALAESQNLIIIGYSGLDIHINFEVRKWVADKIRENTEEKHIIEIVEWSKSDHDSYFWENLFFPSLPERAPDCVRIKLKKRDDILDYDFKLSDF